MKHERHITKALRKLRITAFAVFFGLWLWLWVWLSSAVAGPAIAVWWWVARIPNIWRYDGIPRGRWRMPFRRKRKVSP